MTQSPEKTSGESVYVHLWRLARMEGELMVIAAQQRLSGKLDYEHMGWLYNLSDRFSTERAICDGERNARLSEIMLSIDQFGLSIEPFGWTHWPSEFDKDGDAEYYAPEDAGEPQISYHSENGVEYRSLPWSCGQFDGIVYLPVTLLENSHFEVCCMSQIRSLAIVEKNDDAVKIARYAASHDGGFGDVIVRSTDKAITHTDFETWFLG